MSRILLEGIGKFFVGMVCFLAMVAVISVISFAQDVQETRVVYDPAGSKFSFTFPLKETYAITPAMYPKESFFFLWDTHDAGIIKSFGLIGAEINGAAIEFGPHPIFVNAGSIYPAGKTGEVKVWWAVSKYYSSNLPNYRPFSIQVFMSPYKKVGEVRVNVRPPYGDLDGDCQVAKNDAKALAGFIYYKQPSWVDTATADVSGDGKLTSWDISLILKKITGQIEKFPVEQIEPTLAPAIKTKNATTLGKIKSGR